MPEQVQDFYPTPSTRATCMYYTGIDPDTLQEVYVPKSPKEKATQRALLQYRLPQNAELVKEAYRSCGKAVDNKKPTLANKKSAAAGKKSSNKVAKNKKYGKIK